MIQFDYQGTQYQFENQATGYNWCGKKEQRWANINLLAVIEDNGIRYIIGTISSKEAGGEVPMKWNLETGKHYDEGYSLVRIA